MASYKEVSLQEFKTFVSTFATNLERDVTGICDPPLVTYNDFSGGKVWPESIVAKYHDSECYPKDSEGCYTWVENTYFIKEST